MTEMSANSVIFQVTDILATFFFKWQIFQQKSVIFKCATSSATQFGQKSGLCDPRNSCPEMLRWSALMQPRTSLLTFHERCMRDSFLLLFHFLPFHPGRLFGRLFPAIGRQYLWVPSGSVFPFFTRRQAFPPSSGVVTLFSPGLELSGAGQGILSENAFSAGIFDSRVFIFSAPVCLTFSFSILFDDRPISRSIRSPFVWIRRSCKVPLPSRGLVIELLM